MAKRGRKKIPRINIGMGNGTPRKIERKTFFFLERVGKAQKNEKTQENNPILKTNTTTGQKTYITGARKLDKLLGEEKYTGPQLSKLRSAGFTTQELVKGGLVTELGRKQTKKEEPQKETTKLPSRKPLITPGPPTDTELRTLTNQMHRLFQRYQTHRETTIEPFALTSPEVQTIDTLNYKYHGILQEKARTAEKKEQRKQAWSTLTNAGTLERLITKEKIQITQKDKPLTLRDRRHILDKTKTIISAAGAEIDEHIKILQKEKLKRGGQALNVGPIIKLHLKNLTKQKLELVCKKNNIELRSQERTELEKEIADDLYEALEKTYKLE